MKFNGIKYILFINFALLLIYIMLIILTPFSLNIFLFENPKTLKKYPYLIPLHLFILMINSSLINKSIFIKSLVIPRYL